MKTRSQKIQEISASCPEVFPVADLEKLDDRALETIYFHEVLAQEIDAITPDLPPIYKDRK